MILVRENLVRLFLLAFLLALLALSSLHITRTATFFASEAPAAMIACTGGSQGGCGGG
jgi:hypothetical protein